MDNRLEPDNRGMVGTGVRFDRIRRITGYLVGNTDRWNDAKVAELKDRQKSKLR
ncbi:MAG: ribonucleoside-triphosphate reductase [Oscillospiraceae bacterium]|jgi:anaerobic ribonucleoside-triphosphate reductase|nr:ribonucleoside-triphosphate reductase [Oscillospiraceae bacterium]